MFIRRKRIQIELFISVYAGIFFARTLNLYKISSHQIELSFLGRSFSDGQCIWRGIPRLIASQKPLRFPISIIFFYLYKGPFHEIFRFLPQLLSYEFWKIRYTYFSKYLNKKIFLIFIKFRKSLELLFKIKIWKSYF